MRNSISTREVLLLHWKMTEGVAAAPGNAATARKALHLLCRCRCHPGNPLTTRNSATIARKAQLLHRKCRHHRKSAASTWEVSLHGQGCLHIGSSLATRKGLLMQRQMAEDAATTPGSAFATWVVLPPHSKCHRWPGSVAATQEVQLPYGKCRLHTESATAAREVPHSHWEVPTLHKKCSLLKGSADTAREVLLQHENFCRHTGSATKPQEILPIDWKMQKVPQPHWEVPTRMKIVTTAHRVQPSHEKSCHCREVPPLLRKYHLHTGSPITAWKILLMHGKGRPSTGRAFVAWKVLPPYEKCRRCIGS